MRIRGKKECKATGTQEGCRNDSYFIKSHAFLIYIFWLQLPYAEQEGHTRVVFSIIQM